jgi:hypothetical protein
VQIKYQDKTLANNRQRQCHDMLRLFSRVVFHNMALEEAQVGILAFASRAPGFDAILRHKYSDFKVNELSLDMHLAELRDTDTQAAAEPAPATAGPRSTAALTPERAQACVAAFRAHFGDDMAGTLDAYLQQLSAQVGRAAYGPHTQAPVSTCPEHIEVTSRLQHLQPFHFLHSIEQAE